MMTKPPGFASSSTLPLEDEEESIDESLDEILLEANELLVAADEVNHSSGRLADAPATAQRIPEHPRMT